MLVATINTIGILAATAGAYLLFKYGLPSRNRTGGIDLLALSGEPNEEELAIERRFDALGWTGFGLGVAGAILQIAATWWPICHS